MSRVFDAAQLGVNENYLFSPSSAVYNQKSKVTLAVRVFPTAFGAFDVIMVKDPASSYVNLISLVNGTVFAAIGGAAPATTGKIDTLSVGNGGAGYAFGDLGTIDGGVGATQGYGVFGEIGGVVNNVGTVAPVQGIYTKGQTYNTTRTSGGGAGLTAHVVSVTPATAFSSSTSNEVLTLNQWSSIVVTCDLDGDKVVHIYINGVEATYSEQASQGGPVDDSGGGYYLGNDTFDDGFTGRIAEAAVYTTALSAVQVAALVASTTGVTGSPVAYWHLCGDDSPEPDATGNGNSMTLSPNPPTQGGNSPGYTCSSPPPPSSSNIVIDNPNRCTSRLVPAP